MSRRVLLANAFSANMLAEFPCAVNFAEIPATIASIKIGEAAEDNGGLVPSAVGHAETAELFGRLLGVRVPCHRATVSLRPGDTLLVGQYSGPRLPEGATELPAGAAIRWISVVVSDQ